MYTYRKEPKDFVRTVEVIEPVGDGFQTQKLKVRLRHLGPKMEELLTAERATRLEDIAFYEKLVAEFLDVTDERDDPISDTQEVFKDDDGKPVTLRQALLMQLSVRAALFKGCLEALRGIAEGNAAQ